MMPLLLLFLAKPVNTEVLVYIKFLKEGANPRKWHRVNCFYMTLRTSSQNIQKTKNNE